MTGPGKNGSLLRAAPSVSASLRISMVLKKFGEKNPSGKLTFQQTDGRHLIVDGKMDQHKLRMQLKRVDEKHMLLVKRGFHWVQERPFNR